MIGGTEVSLKLLAENVAKTNEVHVICSGQYKQTNTINDVVVHRIHLKESNKRHFINELYHKDAVRKLAELIVEIKPDIIHTNNLYNFSLYTWVVAKKSGAKVVHTVRDIYLLGSKYFFKNLIFKHYTRFVDCVTAPSDYMINKHLKKNYFSKSKSRLTIKNAIKINRHLFEECIIKRRNCSKDYLNIAFIGRLTVDKGLSLILEYFTNNKFLKDKFLYIFGDGPLKKEIKRTEMLNNNVIFIGELSQEQLYKKLRDIDIVIIPSLIPEAFGRVILDSFQCAIPVIVNDIGALNEIVINGENGYIIDIKKENQLVHTIKLLQNPKIYDELLNNIQTYLELFDDQEQTENFLNAYKKLL